MNILITCAGRRNYLVNYFKNVLKGKGKVVAIDMALSASALAEADIVYQVPGIYNQDYISSLKKIIDREKVDAIISLNDIELPVLAKHKVELEALGAKVLVSDSLVVETCYDKWESYLFFNKIGLKTPKTYLSVEDTLEAINQGEIKYPLLIKPRWGSASLGINIVDNEEELKLTYEYLHLKAKKSLVGNGHATFDIANSLITQEIIKGQEYGIDILNDFNGKYHASFVRKKLGMRSGETDKAISVIDAKFSEIGKKIGDAMAHIGNMDCDFFVSGEDIFLIEMNPRFGGGYPFSHNAGVDIPAIYVSWLEGNSDIAKHNQYKAGLGFAKHDRMIQIGTYFQE
ncbi:MAG: ATP-grasp domain-containing protein [Bacteroidota bacterium]